MVVGLLLVPLPCPGWTIVFTGVALLGTEFSWAERLLQAVRLVQAVRRRPAPAPAPARLQRVPRAVRTAVTSLSVAGPLASFGWALVLLFR